MDYRFYLLDERNRICAGEYFFSPDDMEAGELAAALYGACCDAFRGYEVWRGATRIPKACETTRLDAGAGTTVAISSLLDLVDKLRTSFACVRRSNRLIEVQAQLREQLRTRPASA